MEAHRECPHCGKTYTGFRNPTPAADVIIYEPSLGIVVIERKNTPKGYAIPGGFIEEGEWAEEAAVREMREETGLEVELLGLLGLYSNPDRDPRFHTMTAVYVGKPKDAKQLQAGDDAKHAAFYPLESLPKPLVFDHEQVVHDFSDYLSGKRSLAPLDASYCARRRAQ
ncbi:MAG: NUDIX hydrolase [Desulfovibrio sp.]|nr:NUDIX hydrolase [Desulfovibrio sp.]